MFNKTNKILIVVSLLIVLTIGVGIVWPKNNNTDEKIYSVKLNDKIDHNLFALLVETDTGSGEYKEQSSDTWPEGYTINKNKSNCVDKNGNRLKDVLSFDIKNKKAIVETGETSYCYLYFDKEKPAYKAGESIEKLVQSNQAGLEKSFDGDELEYRFIGSNDEVNNYICMNYQSPTDCILEEENYMYRIIGITGDKLLKIVKAFPYTGMGDKAWHSNSSKESIWESGRSGMEYADVADMLNGFYFYESGESGGVNEYQNYFLQMNWHQGYVTNINDEAYNSFGEDIYYKESSIQTNKPVQVGLPYLSDFYLAAGVTSLYNKNNWMLETLSDAWTMSRYGKNQNQYNTWFVENNNNIFNIETSIKGKLYPVLYLSQYVEITSGTGTKNNPFIAKLNDSFS